VQFSERKNFKLQEDKIQLVFDSLTQLEHPNIVKFHRYWTDTHNDKPRVIFITEYMSSGSLKHFLKRTKRNLKKLPLQSWKRWCTQILSALSYLHSCSPPIVHGNLTCDTIFIQHNGLVRTVFSLFVLTVHVAFVCLPRIITRTMRVCFKINYHFVCDYSWRHCWYQAILSRTRNLAITFPLICVMLVVILFAKLQRKIVSMREIPE
jgi:serine/threonine protein kinase